MKGKTNTQCKKILKLIKLKKGKEEYININVKDLYSYFSKKALEKLKLVETNTVHAKASEIEKLCQVVALKPDFYQELNEQTIFNLKKFINESEKITCFFCSIEYKDLVKKSKVIPFFDFELKSLANKCILKRRFTKLKAIFKKIKKTQSWKKSIERTKITYKTYLDKFKAISKKKWRFKFDLPKDSHINNIMKQLAHNPLSFESSKVLFKEINEYGDLDIDVLTEYFSFNKYPTPDLKRLQAVNHIYDKEITLWPSFILYGTKKSNQRAVNFTIAHEIAHIYTVQATRDLNGFSKKTITNLSESIKSCLYNDPNKDWVMGEDLADLLAFQMIKEEDKNITKRESEILIKSFCHGNGPNEKIDTKEGHSFGITRAYNLVKNNIYIQKALNCRIDEKVCSIEFK